MHGCGGAYGIPYVTVAGTQPEVPVTFVDWPDESDPGPYPIPLGAAVEDGGDRHVIAVDGGLEQLKRVPGSAFEVVDTGPVRTH